MAWWQWSKTAASNANADSTINWAEGMPPGVVNDSARAMMARTAEFRDDTNGSLTTAGTSTAYTVSSNQGFDSLAHMDKQTITVVFHTTSGAAPTLSVDSLSAEPLRIASGVAPPTGAFVEGTPIPFTYYNSTTEFIRHSGGAVGPSSSTANNLPIFADTGGSSLSDSGISITSAKTKDITVIIDGGGSVLTGTTLTGIHIPFPLTINKWWVMADQSGSVSVDILRANDAVPSSSIVGVGTKPNLSSAQFNSSAPSSWTATTLATDDFISFEVTGTPTSVERISVTLTCTQSS